MDEQGSVPKSSFLFTYSKDSWNPGLVSTIGIDFKIVTIDVDGKKVKLQIWDTAGQERFKTISSAYYRGAHGVIAMFDVTNTGTYASIPKFLQDINQNCNAICQILVGINDDPLKQTISKQDAEEFASSMKLQFFETSSKDINKIQEIFLVLTKLMLEKKQRQQHEGIQTK